MSGVRCTCRDECQASEHDYDPIDLEREQDAWMRMGFQSKRARVLHELRLGGFDDAAEYIEATLRADEIEREALNDD